MLILLRRLLVLTLVMGGMAVSIPARAATPADEGAAVFPTPLSAYHEEPGAGLWDVLSGRVAADPFNLVATLIFGLAIVHTFLTARFRHWAHEVEHAHRERLKVRNTPPAAAADSDDDGQPDEVSFKGQILHFLGEVEAVFGIWALALAGAITWYKGWGEFVHYVDGHVKFTEPMFVVVVMAIAASRPVVGFAERCLRVAASLGGGTPAAWWLAILIVAPLLGSFITEPAAMSIAALLLARQFYELKPSPRLSYATIGLLFVNVSVGGTLTHFAAPPVLMVAGTWGWDMAYMASHFGWRAALGIAISTPIYYLIFRKELAALAKVAAARSTGRSEAAEIPFWITAVQLGFLAFSVWQAHHPALFIGAFLFFLAFTQATAHHQSPIDLRPPILVGFFLAGLVIHGGLQAWWIEPILGRLGELPLFIGATVLTAFNDNAAITYLASLVPGFSEELKYAVVAGAVAGGGLTVIANAPNPAGQAILGRFFKDGVSPLGLMAGALVPTVVMALCFMAF